jgi:hypothetical protein
MSVPTEITLDMNEVIAPIASSPLDAYRGRGVKDADLSGATPADAFMKLLWDAIDRKPKTAKEAYALYLYTAEKDIQPLMDKLKAWVITDLTDAEKVVATKLIDEAEEDVEVAEKVVNKVVEAVEATYCCLPA